MKNKNLSIIGLLVLTLIINACASTKKNNSTSGSANSINNMVARMQVKEPIEGVCDNANVIAILPIGNNGQVSAKAPKSEEELTKELNDKVSYLKGKTNYKDKGMVSLIINCKGEMVRCEIDNKSKSPELDKQIVAVFATMKTWTAATIRKQAVDAIELYSFTIKNGKISLK